MEDKNNVVKIAGAVGAAGITAGISVASILGASLLIPALVGVAISLASGAIIVGLKKDK